MNDLNFADFTKLKLGLNEKITTSYNDKKNIKNILDIMERDINRGWGNVKLFKFTKNELMGQQTKDPSYIKEYIFRTDLGNVVWSIDKEFNGLPIIEIDGVKQTNPDILDTFKKYDFIDNERALKEVQKEKERFDKPLWRIIKMYDLKDVEVRSAYENIFDDYNLIRTSSEVTEDMIEDIGLLDDVKSIEVNFIKGANLIKIEMV